MSDDLYQRVISLVDKIKINRDREYHYEVGEQGGRVWIQVLCARPDTYTGEYGTGRGGMRFLRDSSMSDSEIVRACFAALTAYEDHESREAFTFMGVRVFGPHIDIMALVQAGQQIEHRPPPKALGPAHRRE